MFTIYVIYNEEAEKFYIGQTENLSRRLHLHNSKVFNGYTSRFKGEWELIYEEFAPTRTEAIKREKQLKSFRGREYVKQFIPE